MIIIIKCRFQEARPFQGQLLLQHLLVKSGGELAGGHRGHCGHRDGHARDRGHRDHRDHRDGHDVDCEYCDGHDGDW